MTVSAYAPDSGDLIWTDFDPTRGREQAGRRPALVVSASAFSKNTGLAVVCPITSRIRPFPTSVVLPAGFRSPARSWSAIRSIDMQVRPVRYAGAAVPADIAQLVRGKLNSFVAI